MNTTLLNSKLPSYTLLLPKRQQEKMKQSVDTAADMTVG